MKVKESNQIKVIHRSEEIDKLYCQARANDIDSKDDLAITMWISVTNFLKKETKDTLKTIDICCGTGRYFKYILSDQILAVDLSYNMLKKARLSSIDIEDKEINFLCADVERLIEIPELEKDFDLSFCMSSCGMDCDLDFKKLLCAMAFCTKDGGKACLFVSSMDREQIESEIKTIKKEKLINRDFDTKIHLVAKGQSSFLPSDSESGLSPYFFVVLENIGKTS